MSDKETVIREVAAMLEAHDFGCDMSGDYSRGYSDGVRTKARDLVLAMLPPRNPLAVDVRELGICSRISARTRDGLRRIRGRGFRTD